VGAQVPIGAGLAFAHKYSDDGGVSVSYMGDGASNQGQVYEAFNMAALWKLPAVFIIENNQYGMGTSVARHAAGELYKRGAGYDIPGERVDGMDVLAVRKAALDALEHARTGKGPVLLEMMTYRYRGHSMSDPAKYRTKEELEHVREERDPIERLKAQLLRDYGVKETDFEPIEERVKAICLEAVEFSKTSPEPDPSELWTDVLVGV
jgi:pyruvate dehydrogenase E1 component alpha subunit